jgi:hypothetical protein
MADKRVGEGEREGVIGIGELVDWCREASRW